VAVAAFKHHLQNVGKRLFHFFTEIQLTIEPVAMTQSTMASATFRVTTGEASNDVMAFTRFDSRNGEGKRWNLGY